MPSAPTTWNKRETTGESAPASADASAGLEPREPASAMRYYQAGSRRPATDLGELWRRRELVWMFAQRDLKIRYRQTFVGVAWVVLQPLAAIAIFTLFFKLLGRSPVEEGTPYAAALCCGLSAWQLFAGTLTQATNSLVQNQSLIAKVYFPRLALPLSTLVAGLVDFAIASCVLTAVVAASGVWPTWRILTLPAFVGLTLMTAMGAGLWFSSLNALYRDIGQLTPFLLQIGFFLSPVTYSSAALIPPEWRWLHALNPLVGAIEGFRWSVLGDGRAPIGSIVASLVVSAAALASGMWCFRRVELVLSDRI